MGENSIKNKISNIIEILAIMLIPLVGFSSGLIDYVEIDDSVQFVVNTQTYSVYDMKSFQSITIDSDYIIFNNTGFYISTNKNLNIYLDFLHNDIWNANADDLILKYDVNEANSINSDYEISGFSPGTEYEIKRNGFHLCNEIADNDGRIYFSTAKIGTSRYTVFQVGENQGNQPPNTPNNPIPFDESQDVSVDSILYWSCSDPDQDQITYDVYFGTNQNPPLVSENKAIESYNPGELTYSSSYYWKIRATDSNGQSSMSSLWTFSTEELINKPPNKPRNPNPEDNAIGVDIDANLDWYCTDPEGDTLTYDVYFGTNSNPPLVKTSHTESYYTVDTMQFSSTYYWKIISYDTSGNSNQSSLWSFTTSQEPNNSPETPSMPTGQKNISCTKIMNYSTSAIDPDNDQLHYIWDWGDNSEPEIFGPYNSGEICIATHQWHTSGEYQITVRAKDSHYRISAWSEPLTINAYDLPNIKFNRSFSGFINIPIEFNATVTDGFKPYQFHWDFGDGSTSNLQNPTHKFSQSDDYEITLTVIDNKGFQSSNSTICHVANTGDLNVVINAKKYGEIYELINFEGFAEKGTPPYNWEWDFGEGKRSSDQNPVHLFTQKGTYTIQLNVTDSNELSGNDQFTITIYDNRDDKYPPTFEVIHPIYNSLYINDNKILFWVGILAFGDLTIEIEGYDDSSGIDNAKFYVNDKLASTVYEAPYSWKWTETSFLRKTIKIQVYDRTGKFSEQELLIWKFF